MIRYRPQQKDDDAFLYTLYASSREAEMRLTNWDSTQIDIFLKMQFNAQMTHYLSQYKHASFDIIQINGIDAGRLYLLKDKNEIRIIDISLLPEYQGKGYGTQILKNTIEEAKKIKLPLRLSVLMNNPALKLYKRLGFKTVSRNIPYLGMEKLPNTI